MDTQLTECLELSDNDDVEILVAVERAFGVEIDDAQALAMREVGDLYQFLTERIAHVQRRADWPCATATVFWGLRRAVRERRPACAIRPETPVNAIAPILARREWGRYLTTATGLDISGPWVPGWPLFLYALTAVLVFIQTTVAAGIAGALMAALCIWLCGAALFRVQRWPAAMTFGDLASATTARNIGRIAQAQGAVRTGEVWQALVHILAEFSPGSTNIGSKTRFFP